MTKIKFITGPAGSGKSFKLRELIKNEERPHLVCAPTGIAAVNIGGSTIHRTFKINQDSGFVGKRWNDIEVVYIDEASMMGSKLFKLALSGAPNAEFVLVGDMAQLPPVKDKFWFELDNIEFQIEKLTSSYRQKDDEEFLRVLNSIRNGTVNVGQLRWLYSNSIVPEDNVNAITLAFRNDTVKAINFEKLSLMKGEVRIFTAEYSGSMKESDCIADISLALKVGANVIMLNNEKDGNWFNGSRGKIVSMDDESIEVQISNKIFTVKKHVWKLKVPVELTPQRRKEIASIVSSTMDGFDDSTILELKHALATGIEYVVIGTCTQFPMKLAYALTVHKSQGMTLDAVSIITSGFAGCYGIGYVALSRARTIDTVSFDRRPNMRDYKFNPLLKQYNLV